MRLALPVLLAAFGSLACDGAVLPAPSTPEPPPVGQWRVTGLPTGAAGSTDTGPGMTWRFRVDHNGPERQLEFVCETLRDGMLESSEVLVSTPLLEIANVDHGNYSTIENVVAGDSHHVNFRVTLIDLSRHLDGPENAYLQVKRWGERDEGQAICPDAAVTIPALSAKGDQGSGPTYHLLQPRVQGVTEDVVLSSWAKSFKDPAQGPRVESRVVMRLR